jgi:hypothetical protein
MATNAYDGVLNLFFGNHKKYKGSGRKLSILMKR